jgi:hypothetical protein
MERRNETFWGVYEAFLERRWLANVASLAMHRCQGSGFSFPHADLEQVPWYPLFLLVTQKAIPNGDGRQLKPPIATWNSTTAVRIGIRTASTSSDLK